MNEKFRCHRTDFRENWYAGERWGGLLPKFVDKFQFWLKSDRSNWHLDYFGYQLHHYYMLTKVTSSPAVGHSVCPSTSVPVSQKTVPLATQNSNELPGTVPWFRRLISCLWPRSPRSITVQCTWDFWRTKWHGQDFPSSNFISPSSVISLMSHTHLTITVVLWS